MKSKTTQQTSLPPWLQDELRNNQGGKPSWLATHQQSIVNLIAAQVLPHAGLEHWKYSDLSFLYDIHYQRNVTPCTAMSVIKAIVQTYQQHFADCYLLLSIDGEINWQASCLPKEIQLFSFKEALQKQEAMLQNILLQEIDNKHYFAQINQASFNQGFCFVVPTAVQVDRPVHVLHIDTQQSLIQPHNIIHLEKNSQVNIIETYLSITGATSFHNQVTRIQVAARARLQYSKIQTQNASGIHFAYTDLHQDADSEVDYFNFSDGGRFARDDLVVSLNDPGAQCRTSGLYFLKQDTQYVDHHLEIKHRAARTYSNMKYKGILDKQSRAVFNGRLLVEPHAQKIKAEQANHNLLLANRAEVYSKPELEIYADDVKCQHGATIGQLSEEVLFYLRTRGLDRDTATNLLLQSFANEVLETLPEMAVKQYLQTRIENA